MLRILDIDILSTQYLHRLPITTAIYIYIKLKSRPSVCPSITLINALGLLTSTYQLPNTIIPSSSYFKFVTMSECSALCSGLKTKKWRKLEQHFFENHSHLLAFRRSQARIQLVNRFFFQKSICFAYTVFKIQF